MAGAPQQTIRPGQSRRVRSTAGYYPTTHRKAPPVRPRERLPDHHVPVPLEPPDLRSS